MPSPRPSDAAASGAVPDPSDAPDTPDARDTAPDASGQLAEQLLRLTRRMHRAQRRHLEPLGLTPAQSRLLRTVTSFEEPPRMADLARRLDLRNSGDTAGDRRRVVGYGAWSFVPGHGQEPSPA